MTRHYAAGVITGRRGRALYEINENGARVPLDPATIDAALDRARAVRRRIFEDHAARAAARTCLADLLFGPAKPAEESAR